MLLVDELSFEKDFGNGAGSKRRRRWLFQTMNLSVWFGGGGEI